MRVQGVSLVHKFSLSNNVEIFLPSIHFNTSQATPELKILYFPLLSSVSSSPAFLGRASVVQSWNQIEQNERARRRVNDSLLALVVLLLQLKCFECLVERKSGLPSQIITQFFLLGTALTEKTACLSHCTFCNTNLVD